MRSSWILLLLAASFVAAAVVGALFVLGGSASAGLYDSVPADALAVLEARGPGALRYVTADLLASGDRAALPGWLPLLAAPPDLTPEGRVVIAVLPSSEDRPHELLVLIHPPAADEVEGLHREIRARLG